MNFKFHWNLIFIHNSKVITLELKRLSSVIAEDFEQERKHKKRTWRGEKRTPVRLC